MSFDINVLPEDAKRISELEGYLKTLGSNHAKVLVCFLIDVERKYGSLDPDKMAAFVFTAIEVTNKDGLIAISVLDKIYSDIAKGNKESEIKK